MGYFSSEIAARTRFEEVMVRLKLGGAIGTYKSDDSSAACSVSRAK